MRHTRADRSTVGKILAATNTAGGPGRGFRPKLSTFGRGRSASFRAGLDQGPRARRVTIKARVVKRSPRLGALAQHVGYLQRDGVTRDGSPGRLFDKAGDVADGAGFTARCADDRHHFRFIVAPEDAEQLTDLKAFTRDLMAEAERDLGTSLDWVGVEHWNTGHPHIHVLVRGRTDAGQDLVISRDYIGQGLRARASQLATLELGPRTDRDIRRALDAEVTSGRWTSLDRSLARSVDADGMIDLRPEKKGTFGRDDPLRQTRVQRMRTLERFGLAEPRGTGRWRLSPDAEAKMRALGERDDVIARLHRAMASDRGLHESSERAAASLNLDADLQSGPVLGRLVARGLDDELKGSAYAIVDGVDGRLHHIRLGDLAIAADVPIGGVVEARLSEPTVSRLGVAGRARPPVQLLVRSDLDLSAQIGADGATWLDRQLVARAPALLSESGFGAEVRAALTARLATLDGMDLAVTGPDGSRIKSGLITSLKQRELGTASARVAARTGLQPRALADGDAVRGVYRQKLTLASGRFAVIDDGLGFSLVPWRPELERFNGRQVSGVVSDGGQVLWRLGRSRGPSR